MTKASFFRWAIRIVGVAIAAYAVYAVWHFPWTQTGAALAQADWWLLALAAAAHIGSTALRAAEWHVLLEPAATSRWWTALQASLLGAAIATLSLAVAGEGARVKYIGDADGVPAGIAAAGIAWSRFLQLVAGIGMVVLVPVALPLPRRAEQVHVGAAILLAAGIGAYIFFSRVNHGICLPDFCRRPVDLMKRIPSEGGRIPLALGLALGHWTLQWAAYHLVFLAAGVHVGLAGAFTAVVVSNVAWLFRFTPANVGVMQGSIALALLPFGVDPARAVVSGIVLQAVQVVPLVAVTGLVVGGHRFTSIFSRRDAPSEQPA